MTDNRPAPPALPNLRNTRRRSVAAPDQELVRAAPLDAGERLPLLLRPAFGDVDLVSWAADNRAHVDRLLEQHGGILFRGFGLASVEEFREFLDTLSVELMDYEDRSSPRSTVGDGVFTSTDYPDDQPILLHNENSYSHAWPLRIAFFCLVPPATGGETPIADGRRVFTEVPAEVRERFLERGVMYQRNFGTGLGLPWQEVFQTDDPARVEEFCRRADIELEWLDGGRLRTRQVRPAAVRHPHTGEPVWFNQALSFHVEALPPEVRSELLASFSREELPSHCYFGDGSEISGDDLAAVAEAHRRATRTFPWQAGDLLLLDNVLSSHGRAPFTGNRRVVVGMAGARTWSQVEIPGKGS